MQPVVENITLHRIRGSVFYWEVRGAEIETRERIGDEDLHAVLNAFGRDGWRLMTALPLGERDGSTSILFLSRVTMPQAPEPEAKPTEPKVWKGLGD